MSVTLFTGSPGAGMTCAPLKARRESNEGTPAAERSEDAKGPKSGNPPACNTGGKSTGGGSSQGAKVDWLNATFAGGDSYTPQDFLGVLSKVFKRPITGIEGRGLFGFEKGIKLMAHVGSRTFPVGALCYGGEHQRGRWMLQITGAGCGVLTSGWHRLAKLLKALEARITRLDLAVDFLEGQYSVDDAVRMKAEGQFNCGGNEPSTSCAGDWLDGKAGRTLYVGKAANGKMLRVYEKGIQLGQPASPWVRFEVQFGNRDRVIPLEALTQCDAYLAGAYPALESMLSEAAIHIATSQTEGVVTLSHLIFHAKRSYGKLFAILGDLGAGSADLIEEVRVIGVPRRLNPSAITSGVTWASVKALYEVLR